VGPRFAHFSAGLVAVLLAVAWQAESMRRVLIDAGGHLPATRGVTAEGIGTLATQILPMGKPVAAIVLRDRVCVSRFLLLLGGASLAVTATNVRTLAAEAVEEATLPER
jgi:hypothetical protein